MNDFALHPNVYATGEPRGLVQMLEQIWVRNHRPGDGTIYVVSGFGNYNGGVRFFETFRSHVERGGRIVSYFGGSASQRLTSKQLVEELLRSGASVNLVNRKRLLHSKIYGTTSTAGESLIVTSGNFTGPGMGLNVESSVSLDADTLRSMNFSWQSTVASLEQQRWDVYQPSLADLAAPAWRLLYDEFEQDLRLDESEETTLLLMLGHADTARIRAVPGTDAARGTQYFWLSKDCYGFFPPLTIRNERGSKATFSCLINLHYVDLGVTDESCRVTFEAENNLDFRLGTGMLRHTKLASPNDIAAISRVGERDYELRIVKRGTAEYQRLYPYLVTNIGFRGKKYGFADNAVISQLIGDQIGGRARVN